jgi:hypothetical protein
LEVSSNAITTVGGGFGMKLTKDSDHVLIKDNDCNCEVRNEANGKNNLIEHDANQ